MKKSKKKSVIIVLIVLLIALAVGFAAFQTVLTINGSASGDVEWDVKFTDARLLNASGQLDTTHGDADGILSFSDTVVTATGITLGFPGDAVKLHTVITNNGTLPATLTDVTVNTTSLGDDIIVTPATHTEGTQLAAGQSCTNEFTIQWDPDSEEEQVSGSFTVTFTYDQADQTITITPSHSDTTP